MDEDGAIQPTWYFIANDKAVNFLNCMYIIEGSKITFAY